MPNHRRLGLLSLLLGLLWAGCAWAQAEFSPDTGLNFGSWHKTFQGAPAGPTCLVSSNITSLTPDPARCHVYGIQLGTSLTINNPRPGTLLPGEPQIFELQQPSTGSAVTPGIGTNYHLPGGGSSLSGLLSTTNSVRDLWSCQGSVLDTPPQLECQNPVQNIGNLGIPTLLAHATGFNSGSGTTVAITLSSYTGHPLIVGEMHCDGGGCGAATSVISSVTSTSGNSCSQVSGTPNASSGLLTDIWVCGNGTSGSNTVTITCTAGTNGCFYLQASVSEWSHFIGSCEVGSGTEVTGATSISLPTNGATTHTNEVIYAFGDGTVTPTAGQTVIDTTASGATLTSEYQIGATLATYTDTFTTASSSTIAGSVAACR